jgi:ATP-dependent RNA helicase RhlE
LTNTFEKLNIIEPILKALTEEGYKNPTPIQQKAIPVILQGKDLFGCAQTGTGKTAAFAIPILQILSGLPHEMHSRRRIQALILTPTRELAVQIKESFKSYGRHTGLKQTAIFGGVNQKPQTAVLNSGVDILIATPGRLVDLINQGFVRLNDIKIFVLDEADRMLDMGFIHDIKKVIAKLPVKKQVLFFSATLPKDIATLASFILHDPVRIEVTPVSSTVEIIEQFVYFVSKGNKQQLLLHLLKSNKIPSALIFSRTKHGANRIAHKIASSGISVQAIHGNKSQSARQYALDNFKSGKTKILVATDIAARGIDIDNLSHVINFDIPNIPETYVHRIGRTGRAGSGGIALSFCDHDEKEFLADIHKLITKTISVISDHPFPLGPNTHTSNSIKQKKQFKHKNNFRFRRDTRNK